MSQLSDAGRRLVTPTKRDLSHRIDALAGSGDYDGPEEIIIIDSVVHDRDEEPVPTHRTRCWCDEFDGWHSERIDLRDSGGTPE